MPQKKDNHSGKKRFYSALQTILAGILGIVIGLTIYRMNSSGLMRESMPMPFGYGAAVVMSGSMEPALKVDDLTIVKKTNDLDVGDVVVYEADGFLIVHRIMEISGETVVTKGDANNAKDPPVHVSQIKGVVVRRLPRIGRIFSAVRTPAGTVIVLAVLVLLFVASRRKTRKQGEAELDNIRKEITKLKEEGERESEGQ